MTKKLKIDQTSGTLEIEGTEEFVKNIYDDFKERLTSPRPATSTPVKNPQLQQLQRRKVNPKKAVPSSGNFSKPKKTPGIAKTWIFLVSRTIQL